MSHSKIEFEDSDDEELTKEDSTKEGSDNVESTNDEEEDFEIYLSVAVTGARPGDVVIGRQKCTNKAMLRLYKNQVFPDKKRLDFLRKNKNVWDKFISKLSSLAFFVNMKHEEREEWLNKNQNTIEFIGDDPSGEIQVEVLDAGESMLASAVENEDLETLMEGKEEEFYTIKEVESFFPRKPGSGARKHTLFFMKCFWTIVSDYKMVDSFSGVVFDVERGIVLDEYTAKEDEDIIVVDGIVKDYKYVKETWIKKSEQTIAFMVPKERFDLSKIDAVINEVYTEMTNTIIEKDIIDKVKYDLREYTAGSYKSLMQKVIRFSPDKVSLSDETIVDSDIVVLVVVAMLAQNPGSFVPDIQRYVTGIESVAKRLGIICGFEDVYVPEERVHELVSLFSGALLAQRVRSWKPSKNLLKQWMITAYKSMKEPKSIDRDREMFKEARDSNKSITNWWAMCYEKAAKMRPYSISKDQSPIKMCSAVLDILRTFEGDIGMTRHIASTFPKCDLITQKRPDNLIMPICHGTDQHWAAGMIYFFSYKTVRDIYKQGDTSPFWRVFNRVFTEVTGMNPRRTELPNNYEDDEFVKEVRRCQKLFLLSKQGKKIKRKAIKREPYKMSYTLNNSWLAGMVGAIEIPGHPATIVTLRPENIYQLIAIRKPSRNMEESITPEREENSKKIAYEMLRNGIKLKGTHPPSSFFLNATVKLEGDEYNIISGGISYSWEDARTIDISLVYHNAIDKTMENAITMYGDGIEINAFSKFDKMLERTDNSVLYRVLSYISNYKKEFEMNRVSRDGTGTYQSVNLDDVRVFKFILDLSILFPAALRAVEKCSQKFSVPNGPLLWDIVSKIKTYLQKDVSVDGWDDVEIKDSLERVSWAHQTETTEEMARNFKSGTKGNFLWLKMGMGKSKIVMDFIVWLKSIGKLPTYILYTLPPSAVESVVHEISSFGLNINYIIPLKSIKNKKIPKAVNSVTQKCVLEPYSVNIIVHDHVRRCSDELLSYASDCLFLVDEVHKGLNETKRTTTLLDIAKLSKLFVAFTGTPVIDNKIYKLIWWLEQIVEFEINMNNFWVSANSMVARKVTTGVIVNRKEVLAKFEEEELKEYKKLVPVAMGGENRYASNTDFNDAYKLCCNIVASRRMIEETMRCLGESKGVMLVAQNKTHQDRLYSMLIEEDIDEDDIFVLTGNNSIFLTDTAVKKKTVHDYKVIIVPVSRPEGYTATRLRVMITSVYPSNEATRDQIEGRINRICQAAKEIEIIVVHCGILTYILKNHNQAKSLSIALSDMAKNFVL